jgi:hypothetical protein
MTATSRHVAQQHEQLGWGPPQWAGDSCNRTSLKDPTFLVRSGSYADRLSAQAVLKQADRLPLAVRIW